MCITRRDIVLRQVMHGEGGRVRRPARGGIFIWCVLCVVAGFVRGVGRLLSQDAPAVALCSLRHPRMLGGAKGRVWGGEGNGGSLITACYLLLFFTYFKLNPTMYPTYHTISDYKRM